MSVTCIDCGVSFYGDDYSSHLICISEAEKYEKSLYKKNEKLSPQDAWMQVIATSIDQAASAPSDIQKFLPRLSEFNNIPRNKRKFANFLLNSLRIQSTAVVDSIWNHLSSHAENSNKTEEKASAPASKPVSKKSVEDTAGEEDDEERERKKKLKKEKKRLRGTIMYDSVPVHHNLTEEHYLQMSHLRR
jgi:cell growth-regulating nucleolar protein